MARVRLTYVTPNGQIFPIDIDYELDDIETIGNLLSMVLIVDELAREKGLSIMGKKLETTKEGAKATSVPKIEGVREGNKLYRVVSIDVLPKPGGQTQVAFFGNDFRPESRNDYASLFVLTSENWGKDKLQELLAPYHTFKLETFEKAGTYNVDFMAEYYETEKTNTAGNPYRNVVRIHVKEDATKPSIGKYVAPPAPEQPSEPEIPSGPKDIPF